MNSIDEFSPLIKQFCEDRQWDQFHGPKDLAIGIATEASELLEIFRFLTPEQIQVLLKSEEGRTKVGDELADVLFFILRFAQRNGIDLKNALATKLEKNARKYPVEKACGKNLKYTDLD